MIDIENIESLENILYNKMQHKANVISMSKMD